MFVCDTGPTSTLSGYSGRGTFNEESDNIGVSSAGAGVNVPSGFCLAFSFSNNNPISILIYSTHFPVYLPSYPLTWSFQAGYQQSAKHHQPYRHNLFPTWLIGQDEPDQVHSADLGTGILHCSYTHRHLPECRTRHQQ